MKTNCYTTLERSFLDLLASASLALVPCAITTGVLAVLTVVPATAGAVDVTHPNNVLGGLAATPANVAVNSMYGGPVSALTDNQAFDGAQDGPFTFADAPPEELLAITGFNAGFNTVRIYTAQDPSRQLGDITLKASATSKTSLHAADYELNLGTFPANTRTYTDYIHGGRVYYDLAVKAPAGTKSLFLATKQQANGGRIYEIQALDRKPNEVSSGASAAAEVIPVLIGPPVRHDKDGKLVTMADAKGNLLLRLNYDGRCMLDQVIVRGRDVVSPATGAYSSIRVGTAEATTRKLEASPQVAISENTVTVSGIRFVGGGIDLEETWTFAVQPERIVWRIARKYLNAGTLDDTCFPGFDFTSRETWTGDLLDTGGVAWFKLFDTPVATYGVHASQVTFWNKDTGAGLRIVPTAAAGQQGAVRFSRQPSGVLSFNYLVTADRLAPKQGLYRFLRDKQDVWAPFRVTPGEMVQEMELYGLDYQQTYDRGELKGIGGAAVREICNTIARLGVIDRNIIGSNGWYSGYAVLQEGWLAKLGLAINDPAYFQAYGEALDYQREHAIAPDGRIKSRWAYGPWDAMPGTYDPLGFYEAQWGYFLDSQPDWVINVAEQFDFTGDRPWVSRQKAACEQALDFMLRRDSNHNGLVEIMTNSHEEKRGGDWLDIIWSSFEPATINAQMYEALVLWADVEEELGDPARAAAYRKHAATLKAAYNRPTAEGGFWNPEKKWYVHWRDRDGSIHGDNLVLPVNFMAIGYGLCDDPVRRDAILRQVEEQMQKEKLFFWPACIYSYRQEEGHDGNWPFPKYENGDIFLAWGELGTRAYAAYDPRVALRCVKNVLDQYAKDGLAFQRYSRSSQTGVGEDILSNMANPIVGLYRNIYGIQPKWNRLYLEPHMTKELDGTRLKYWLRGQWYTLEPGTDVHRIDVGGFAVSDSHPLAVAVKGDILDYFRGKRKTPSMTVTRSATVPLELRIETWPDTGNGARKWSETCGNGAASTRHVVCDLVPNTDYKLSRNGAAAETLKSDAAGCVTFEVGPGDSKPMVLEITGM